MNITHCSNILEKDIERLERAAKKVGIQNLEINWSPDHKRWRFHLKGIIKNKPIVMAFDPTQRYYGGTPKDRDKLAFEEKKDWALKQDLLFFVPHRNWSTLEMEIYLKFWLSKKGIKILKSSGT